MTQQRKVTLTSMSDKARIRELEREREELLLRLRSQTSNPPRFLKQILIMLGGFCLIVGISFPQYTLSSLLVFIGLGFLFWGSLLMYVTPNPAVQTRLLNALSLSLSTTLEYFVQELDLQKTAIFLPPNSPIGSTTEQTFIPMSAPDGVFIPSPGFPLTELYEEIMGKSFTDINFSQLQTRLPEIFIEELELAEELNIRLDGEQITVTIRSEILSEHYRHLAQLKSTSIFGFPFSSSIGIALARTFTQPIRITDNYIKDNIIETQYLLLSGEESTA